MTTPKLEGFEVENSQVQSFVKKHGPASYSKPHGPGKMILYYPAPPDESEEEDVEPFEDHAGEKTTATRSRIEHTPAGSKVVSTPRVAGAGPPPPGRPRAGAARPGRCR